MTLTASCTLALAVAVPATANAQLSHSQTTAYGRAYAHVVHVFGFRAAGCKLIGPHSTCHQSVTDAAILTSTDVLRRMFAPRPAPVVVTTYHSSYSSSISGYAGYVSSSGGCGGITPYSGGGQCWAIPYGIVHCESGGQNIPNRQGSGANGYYQLMVGGGGSRAQQDQLASHLWNGGKGASNWTCAK